MATARGDVGGAVWSTFAVPKGCDGGSFWQMFGDNEFVGPSPLDILLESPDCSIEALMDEEDIIQEFKARQSRLVTRLCKPDAALKLIDFITREPPEGASSALSFTYPFIAMQLLTCGVDELFETWVDPEHRDILDRFWGFLETSPPEEFNPVLAGYFSRVACLLYRRYPEEMAGYLRARGADALFDSFVARLHSRSLAELFARLVCAETPAHVIFPSNGVVNRLVSLLESVGSSCDKLESVAMVLRELIARKDAICFTDDLIVQISSRATMDLLTRNCVSKEVGRASAAISIISSAIFHTSSEIVQATFPIYQPLAPPPVMFVGEEIPNIGFAANEAEIDEALPPKPPGRHPVRSLSGASLNFDSLNTRIVGFVCSHMTHVRKYLDGFLETESPSKAPIGVVSAVGSTTLELVFLLALLVRSDRDLAVPALHREQLLPRCFKIMLRHPWSSLLHNAMGSLFSEVLGTVDDVATKLVVSFTSKGGLLEDMVAEYAAQREFEAGERQRRPRAGYMGHLHTLCCELRGFAVVPEFNSAVASIVGWSDIVLPAVAATLQLLAEELGGGVPPEERGLASSSMAWPGAASFQEASQSDLPAELAPFGTQSIDGDKAEVIDADAHGAEVLAEIERNEQEAMPLAPDPTGEIAVALVDVDERKSPAPLDANPESKSPARGGTPAGGKTCCVVV